VVARPKLTLALHPSILERLLCVQTRRLLGSPWRLEEEAMSILTILIGVVLAIVILWAVNTYLPHPIRLILNIVVIVVLLVVLLSIFGLLGPLSRPIGRLP
jgi:peptidoglycan biosynthesis protein MviN/MurJ (putative lipid II flippase)